MKNFGYIYSGDVRMIIQDRLGIPMSIFYLMQIEGDDRELYDIHTLSYYKIKVS